MEFNQLNLLNSLKSIQYYTYNNAYKYTQYIENMNDFYNDYDIDLPNPITRYTTDFSDIDMELYNKQYTSMLIENIMNIIKRDILDENLLNTVLNIIKLPIMYISGVILEEICKYFYNLYQVNFDNDLEINKDDYKKLVNNILSSLKSSLYYDEYFQNIKQNLGREKTLKIISNYVEFLNNYKLIEIFIHYLIIYFIEVNQGNISDDIIEGYPTGLLTFYLYFSMLKLFTYYSKNNISSNFSFLNYTDIFDDSINLDYDNELEIYSSESDVDFQNDYGDEYIIDNQQYDININDILLEFKKILYSIDVSNLDIADNQQVLKFKNMIKNLQNEFLNDVPLQIKDKLKIQFREIIKDYLNSQF